MKNTCKGNNFFEFVQIFSQQNALINSTLTLYKLFLGFQFAMLKFVNMSLRGASDVNYGRTAAIGMALAISLSYNLIK